MRAVRPSGKRNADLAHGCNRTPSKILSTTLRSALRAKPEMARSSAATARIAARLSTSFPVPNNSSMKSANRTSDASPLVEHAQLRRRRLVDQHRLPEHRGCCEQNAPVFARDVPFGVPLPPVGMDPEGEGLQGLALLAKVETGHVRGHAGAVGTDASRWAMAASWAAMARSPPPDRSGFLRLPFRLTDLALDHTPHEVVGGDGAQAFAKASIWA